MHAFYGYCSKCNGQIHERCLCVAHIDGECYRAGSVWDCPCGHHYAEWLDADMVVGL